MSTILLCDDHDEWAQFIEAKWHIYMGEASVT